MSAPRSGFGRVIGEQDSQDQSSALRATATKPRNSMPVVTRKYRFNFLSGKVGSGPFSFSDRRKDGDA